MNRKKIKDVGRSLFLEVSDEALKLLEKDYNTLIKRIDKMIKIDTSGVEPLSRLNESNITHLRKDVSANILDRDVAFKNTSFTDDGYFIIEKVVNDV